MTHATTIKNFMKAAEAHAAAGDLDSAMCDAHAAAMHADKNLVRGNIAKEAHSLASKYERMASAAA